MAALPAQTALAMLALQDQSESRTALAKAGQFLRTQVGTRPSTLSLALAILAFDATGQDTGSFPDMVEGRQGSEGDWKGAVHLTALSPLALRAVKEGWNAFKLQAPIHST